ncbi:MAG TPA: ABC transporter ATP-binding protein [bacterium]|nr:ABC transporter ATP-binding protein [bacterium]HOL34311.1 ABC transporter ATP-binding protein [bacterium]HPP08617.1 ABC transporter ATP-binding protein [bacterium]
MVVLEFKNVSAGYGKNIIIHNISFQMKKGRFLGIIGPNGSGKSTLLKTATKVIKHYTGTILFNGANIKNIPVKEFAQNISFLPSDIEIAYPYTVKELLLMARYPFISGFRSPASKDIAIVNSIAKQMGLAQFMNRTILEMSEGEKQRVLLAQCLVQEPRLVIFDEPTAHLDIGYQFSFLDLLKQYQEHSSLSILAVLHDLNLASQYCDELILLNEGSVVISGDPQQVLQYKILEEVYHTNVLVYPHPISGKPYVFGVPASWKNLTKK